MDYATLHVPAEALTQYQGRSPWNQFARIVPIDEVREREVTLSNAGYATFYDSEASYILPATLSASVVTDVVNDKIQYQVIADGRSKGIIPAGVAVMLTNSQKKGGTFTLAKTEGDAEYTGSNLLHGSDEATMTEGDGNCLYYKLAYGASDTNLSSIFGWYWGAASGGSFLIEGHRAWLAIPSHATQQKIRSFNIDGEATEIAELAEDGEEEPVIYYDLQGRRVNRPVQGGIYIVNGKKVAIR